MLIESKQNPQIKHLNKLNQKKYRDEYNEFLVYGEKLVSLAKEKGIVKEVYTSNPNKGGILITKKLMGELSVTKTDYDILAICEKKNHPIDSNKILVLEDIQDPTNVGALLRSALAFNFKHVILSNKCADIYNDKTIRASGGALFSLFVERNDIYQKINKYKKEGYKVYGADAHKSGTKIDKSTKSILVLGNEGMGLSNEIKPLIDSFINIPTNEVESLNVSVAGSILMYEWSLK